jgi:hypothetical protein
MTKKPLFWLLLPLASLLGLLFSWQQFEQAFPSLNLQIEMSRDSAEQAARQRAQALHLAAPDAKTALRFAHQEQAQNFIELEAGGPKALRQFNQQQILPLWQWEVRFFRERDPDLSTLFFTPQGQPWGFERHVPEQQPGAALSAALALPLALRFAKDDWQLDLTPGQSRYVLREQSFKKQSNGRIDHDFVFERPDIRLGPQGEGRVQLQLRLSGDRLSRLQYRLKIPESFERRYREMRSANNNLARIGSLAMVLLYGVAGCGIGLLWLWRQGYLVLRPALYCAGAIALLQGAAALNAIPGSWFDYDSAISGRDFLAQMVGDAVSSMVPNWMILAISLLAAESLTRKAFGHLPQLWQLGRIDAASSRQVLGQTLGGYLWVGLNLAFITGFYYLAQHYWGWWTPQENLSDPNVLATPLPWLPPLAAALHAGVWEECLFRAVPLAGTALLWDALQARYPGRVGSRGRALALALVLQALIFGLCHANYAQQPAFARPLEIFLPALAWGAVYLRFGLLPGILCHTLFDLLLMSLPLFALHAPGLWPDRLAIILAASLPLLWLGVARWRNWRWHDLPAARYNHSYTARTPGPGSSAAPVRQETPERWYRVRRLLPLLGIGGIVLALALPAPRVSSVPFALSRAAAEAQADSALAERGVRLGANWRHFSVLQTGQDEGGRFIWQQAGSAAWHKLFGHYLTPPVWLVRYLHFDGDVVERAEEWQIEVEQGPNGRGKQGGNNDGQSEYGQHQDGSNQAPHVRSITHLLPESRAGADLSEQDARSQVQQALQQRFSGAATPWREIKAQQQKMPHRTDWLFTLTDDAASPLHSGEARIDVKLAGAEVVQIRRYIYLPESWQREQRARRAPLQPIRQILLLLCLALMPASLWLALKQAGPAAISSPPDRPDRPNRRVRLLAGLVLLMLLLGQLNGWQSRAIGLQTTQSASSQLLLLMAGQLLFCLLGALLCGLLMHANCQATAEGKLGRTAPYWPGLALAALLWGLDAVFLRLVPPEHPPSLWLAALNSESTLLAALAASIPTPLLIGNLLAFVLVQLTRFNLHFTRHQLPTLLILLLLGFTSASFQSDLPHFLLHGAGSGLLLVLLYLLVARFEPQTLLVAVFGWFWLSQLPQLYSPGFPKALPYLLCYSIGLAGVGYGWFSLLQKAESAPV